MIIDTEVKILVSSYHEHDITVDTMIIIRFTGHNILFATSIRLLHNIFTTGAI